MSAKQILHVVASFCCTVFATVAFANSNASLTLISEDGVHMATRLQYSDGTSEWVGFRSKFGSPIGPGEIDLRDRTSRIRVYVLLPCDSDQLRKAREEVVADFDGSTYRLNNNNCVFFACELARKCGYDLKDGFDVGKTPEEIVGLFAEKFKDQVVFNVRPFPWEGTKAAVGDGLYLVKLDNIKCHKSESILTDDKVYTRVYISNQLVFESKNRYSLGRGDSKTLNQLVATVNSGQTIAIQLWDDDQVDRDDLIFDMTLDVSESGTVKLRQKKGEPLLGSESVYEVQVTTEVADPNKT